VEWLVVLAVVWIACAGLGYWVASEKGRNPVEGLILGLVFSVIGVFIEAMLPNVRRAPIPTWRAEPEDDGSDDDTEVASFLGEIDEPRTDEVSRFLRDLGKDQRPRLP
jgi:hypothetical protein